jgi:putative transposon-encoded protein
MKKEIVIRFEGSEIIERVASKFGTGCHVIVPKEYAGKKIKIILDETDDKNEKK